MMMIMMMMMIIIIVAVFDLLLNFEKDDVTSFAYNAEELQGVVEGRGTYNKNIKR